jgi:Ca2+-binding RTX toxin-like protein
VAVYRFGALADGQAIGFRPTADVLNFDQSAIAAADIRVAAEGSHLRVSVVSGVHAGKDVLLQNTTALQLTTGNTTFANGSRLIHGDNSTGTGGDNGSNSLTGTSGRDHLSGFGGADTLNGGSGADLMAGGLHDDVYIVDNAGDAVIELDGGGANDEVRASVSYALTAWVNNLTLTGSAAIDGTGNELGNLITGNGAANRLAGGAGNDTLAGGAGTDTAVYAGARAQYTALTSGGNMVVGHSGGADGVDRLRGIEQLQFADGAGQAISALHYTASYGDLINAFGSNQSAALDHYVAHGYAEGRVVSFDALRYIASYGDLIRALGTNADAGAQHFIDWGFDEGRATTFDSLRYIASHIDLIEILGADADAGELHFIDWGFEEGRGTTFNAEQYLANYEDLRAAFGSDTDAAIRHFIVYGYSEGRTDQPGGTPSNDSINGTPGDDRLFGGQGNDTLRGFGGNDTLHGGPGADVMDGGADNDVFIVDRADDSVIERDGGGTHDEVQSTAGSFTLPAWVDHLTLAGTAPIDGAGNELANRITGNSAANTLDGGPGADTLDGGAGDDTYVVRAGDFDTIVDSGGSDTVRAHTNYILDSRPLENLVLAGTQHEVLSGTGNTLANRITVETGRGIVDGGEGNDTLIGGSSDDWFSFAMGFGNYGQDVIDGRHGRDLISFNDYAVSGITVDMRAGTLSGGGNGGSGSATFTSIEQIDGTRHADHLIGNDGFFLDPTSPSPFFTGAWINGFGGNDTISGGAGDERLAGHQGDDRISGGGGLDWLHGGEGNDLLEGGAGNDVVTPFSISSQGIVSGTAYGSDTIDGGEGVDTLYLWGAPSAAVVNLTTGVLTGGGAGGTGSATFAGIEDVVGTGFADSIAGNSADNTIRGGEGVDTIDGGAGDDSIYGDNFETGPHADLLFGGSGNDRVVGGDAADTVDGGTGNDTLHGQIGDDAYVFTASPGAANFDTVFAFDSGEDKVHLDDAAHSDIGPTGEFAMNDARFAAGAGFTSGRDADDRVIYDASTGNLYYDADGSAPGAAQLIATFENQPAIAASDIVVI